MQKIYINAETNAVLNAHRRVAEQVIQGALLTHTYAHRSTSTHTIASLCLFLSRPLTRGERPGVNYKPLSLPLKQLQPKPESPQPDGSDGESIDGKRKQGMSHDNRESDFRTNGSE